MLGNDLNRSFLGNATENGSVNTAFGGAGDDTFEVVHRRGPSIEIINNLRRFNGIIRGGDTPNRIRGGSGSDEVFINANNIGRVSEYGVNQYTIFEDFQPSLDDPVNFQIGDERNFRTQNRGSGTDVFYRVGTQGIGSALNIPDNFSPFEILIFRFEGHRNVSINDPIFFNFLEG